jgi:single-strand DNA-binding protein
MIIGRLTRDPEVRTTPNGANVVSFSIATNFNWTNQQGQKQEQVEFHNIVAWRKLADIIGQYLKKGSKIYVEGRLQTRTWDGNDGQKRNRTEIVADNIIMLDSKGANAGVTSAPEPSDNVAQPTAPADTDIQINDNDIPF